MVDSDYKLSFMPYSLLTSIQTYIAAGVDIIKIQGRDLAQEVVIKIVRDYRKMLGGNEH